MKAPVAARSWRKRIRGLSIVGLLIALAVATAAAIFQSIIGSFVSSALIPWLDATIRPIDLIILALGVFIVVIVMYIAFREGSIEETLTKDLSDTQHANHELEHASQRANSALKRLSSAYATVLEQQHTRKLDLEAALQELCRSAVGSICDYYDGRVLRGSILVVSIEHPNFLVWHSGFGFEEAERAAKRFFIGSEHDPQYHGEKRGIAGEAWITRSTIVTHIDRATKVADNPGEFIDFERDRATYAFASFVCLLLKTPYDPAPCGMLCLDSVDRETFDADPECTPVRPLIEFLARLLDMRQRLLVNTHEVTHDPIVWE